MGAHDLLSLAEATLLMRERLQARESGDTQPAEWLQACVNIQAAVAAKVVPVGM